MTNAAAGETRNATAAATSSGVPHRPSGVAAITVSWVRTSAPASHLVWIQPGATTLTRTRGANSRARQRLMAATPPFAAA